MKKWYWLLLVIGMWWLWPAANSQAEDVFDWPGLKEATYDPGTGVGTVVVPPPEIYALANKKYTSVISFLTTETPGAPVPLNDIGFFKLAVDFVRSTASVEVPASTTAISDDGYVLKTQELYAEFSFHRPGDYVFKLNLTHNNWSDWGPKSRLVTFHVLAETDLPPSAKFILDGQTITSDRVLQIFLRDDQQRIFAPKISKLDENPLVSKTLEFPWLTPLQTGDTLKSIYKVQSDPNMGVTVKRATINIRNGEFIYEPNHVRFQISGYYPAQPETNLSITWSFAKFVNHSIQNFDNILVPYSELDLITNIKIELAYNTKKFTYDLVKPANWPKQFPVTPATPLTNFTNQLSIWALNQETQVFDLNWPSYQLTEPSSKLTMAASTLINGGWTLPFMITFPAGIADAALTPGAEVAISGNDQHLIDFRGTMLRIPRTNRAVAGQYQLTLTLTQVSGP